MKKTFYILTLLAICLITASCGKSVSKESKLAKSQQEQMDSATANSADSIILPWKTSDTIRIDSVVTEEFSRLLRYWYPWIPKTGEVGHFEKLIPNLGPKGETNVYVCIGNAIFDNEVDCIFLLTNAKWDDSDYFGYRDCLNIGPKNAGDGNEHGDFVYNMTYDIHDTILTISTKETKSFYDWKTKTDTLLGSLTITHTYSVSYWGFRYLSSDTVLYGETTYLGGVFVPRKAHLGYKIASPKQWRVDGGDDELLENDPRWVYAEEKLWDPEVCAFLCDLTEISDGWLAESLSDILFCSLNNNPETNHCMAEYLATLPAEEQERLLQVFLYMMSMYIYDYSTDPEQLIYPDFDSFMQAFPVFDSPYNSKIRY